MTSFALLTKVVSSHDYGKADGQHRREDFAIAGLESHVPAFSQFDGEMFAGLIPMNNGDRKGKLMFWLYVPVQSANPQALTIWLNGGPGCSSFGAGLFFENGPITVAPRPAGYCCLKEDEPLQYNTHAWTNASALLYIEQPVGVGFSTGPEPINEDELSGDMYAWLLNFYSIFNEFRSSQLYIFGESYAGMYVPSIAYRIYQENLKLAANDVGEIERDYVALEGIALGNGWMDARVQGPATIDYAYWHGLIDEYTRENLNAEWARCRMLKSNYHPDQSTPFHPFNIPDDCAMMEGVLEAAGKNVFNDVQGITFPLGYGPNTYDITTWDPYRVIDDGNNTIYQFFNDFQIKEIIHAPLEMEWAACVPGAGRRRRRTDEQSNHHGRGIMLENDRPISTVPYIAELLNAGIRVLVYNGDRDLSTNVQGSEMLLNSMEWQGRHEWKKTHRGLWIVEDREKKEQVVGGYAKEVLGLSFVVVSNSGHLVPFNQPLPALDMIKRFVLNKSFVDYKLPNFSVNHTQTMNKIKVTVTHDTSSVSLLHSMAFVGSLLLAFCAGYFAARSRRKSDGGYHRIANI